MPPPAEWDARERTAVSPGPPSALGAPPAPARPVQRNELKQLLFIWLFAALCCGEMLGQTQVHIKHHCHSWSFKIVNRWKKSRQDGCVLITHVRQGDLFWHTVLSQSPI